MDLEGRFKASVFPGSGSSLRRSETLSSSLATSKSKPSLGRSVLDPDALASSDDELDSHVGPTPLQARQPQRPIRRSSWLNDPPSRPHRQASYGASDSVGQNSNPSTAAEANPWTPGGSTASRGHSSNSSFPWGNAIWNNEGQKGTSSRLGEVLPSPTSVASAGFANEPQRTPPLRRDSSSEAAIPFAIPLHPTLKAYRSQSYSVGQLDQEITQNNGRTNTPQHIHSSRTRAGSSYVGLQHRPSRPSMFGDFSPDTSVLGQLREVDDDGETSTTSSEAGFRVPNLQARTIEQLAMENAILRQQSLMGQGPSVTPHGAPQGRKGEILVRANVKSTPGTEAVVEESDEVFSNSGDEHRLHDYHRPFRSPDSASDKEADSFKKAHWQSSLGFTGIAEPGQSRRHSFAEVPLRHSSVSSNIEAMNCVSGGMPGSAGIRDEPTRSPTIENSFFSPASTTRSGDFYRPSSSSSSQPSQQVSQSGNHPLRLARVNMTHHQQPQTLYLVTFKAARAEFYYVQEGTGLEVNPGDLVVVEADRGTDLGTVAHKDVDWAAARQLKERYVTEHYNWLMMFSRQGQGSQVPGLGPSARSAGSNPNTTSRMGSNDPPATFDSLASDIKPKMIKRLAQSHEIHSLREKEGNEAKAKRMCQQKVAEHHLNMEILDAEFQMDWKKLTFYYFAEAYVNFNPLVTDLFKIYKTRIWMSAINPASFASPTAYQIPQGPAPQLADRDRIPELRNRPTGNALGSVDYHAIPRGPLGPVWNDPYGVSIPGQSGAQTYNQVFQASAHSGRYPPTLGHSQDFARGVYPSGGVNTPYGPMAYPLAVDGSHGPAYDIHEINDESSNVVYGSQIKSFQNLSLGT